MSSRVRTLFSVVALLVLVSNVGCKKLLKKKLSEAVADTTSGSGADAGGTAKGGRPTAGAGSDSSDPDEALRSKLSTYIGGCTNAFSKRVLDSASRYYSWCNEKTGPTGKERIIYGLYGISDEPKKCAEAVDKANAKDPDNAALEKAATEFSAALAVVIPLINDADKYYDHKDYQDDKMAKGKTMHEPLAKAFTRFEAANVALRKQIAELNGPLETRELAKIEKTEGKKLQWQVQNTYLAGKKVMDLTKGPIEKITLESYKPAVEELETAVRSFEDYSKVDKAAASKGSSVYSSADKFLQGAKALLRRIRDKTPYSRGEKMNLGGSAEWMVDGSPGQVVTRYNEFIDAVNRMH